jgi:hypothetical protein
MIILKAGLGKPLSKILAPILRYATHYPSTLDDFTNLAFMAYGKKPPSTSFYSKISD